MNRKQKNKLTMIIFIMLCVAGALAFGLYALRQNIDLYYTPSQISLGQAPKHRLFRVGGIVRLHSIHRQAGSKLVSFVLTDTVHDVKVIYSGILPDLFRAGQGIVAQGSLNNKNIFIATQVLAKHDATYMPKPVLEAIKAAKAKVMQQKKESHVY